MSTFQAVMQRAEKIDPDFELFEFCPTGVEKIALTEAKAMLPLVPLGGGSLRSSECEITQIGGGGQNSTRPLQRAWIPRSSRGMTKGLTSLAFPSRKPGSSSRGLTAGSRLKIKTTLLPFSNHPDLQFIQRRLTIAAWQNIKASYPNRKSIAPWFGLAHQQHPNFDYPEQRITQPFCRSTLKWILQDITGCEQVDIQENVPQLIEIPCAHRNQLGIQCNTLSMNFRIGKAIPDRQVQLNIILWVKSLKRCGPNLNIQQKIQTLLKELIPSNLTANVTFKPSHPRRFQLSKSSLFTAVI